MKAVEQPSSASRAGIKSGDLLLGVDKWETVTASNLDFIAKTLEAEDRSKARIYIMRDGAVLFGEVEWEPEAEDVENWEQLSKRRGDSE